MKTHAILIALAASALTGCAVEDNLRLSVGTTVPMQSLPPVVADEREGLIGSADHDNIPGDEPSITGLDRSHLAASEFRVPIDGTYHHPHNTLPIATTDTHARQRGEYPSYESVLEQSDPDLFTKMYELIAIPAWSVVELAWLAPTLIIDGPWETTSSPSTLTNRTSSETRMLVPGLITLTRAELDDLENASNVGNSEANTGANE
jgi:hypothetical protein